MGKMLLRWIVYLGLFAHVMSQARAQTIDPDRQPFLRQQPQLSVFENEFNVTPISVGAFFKERESSAFISADLFNRLRSLNDGDGDFLGENLQMRVGADLSDGDLKLALDYALHFPLKTLACKAPSSVEKGGESRRVDLVVGPHAFTTNEFEGLGGIIRAGLEAGVQVLQKSNQNSAMLQLVGFVEQGGWTQINSEKDIYGIRARIGVTEMDAWVQSVICRSEWARDERGLFSSVSIDAAIHQGPVVGLKWMHSSASDSTKANVLYVTAGVPIR